jgi:hypothetical protein
MERRRRGSTFLRFRLSQTKKKCKRYENTKIIQCMDGDNMEMLYPNIESQKAKNGIRK